jgi:hypothetical protein
MIAARGAGVFTTLGKLESPHRGPRSRRQRDSQQREPDRKRVLEKRGGPIVPEARGKTPAEPASAQGSDDRAEHARYRASDQHASRRAYRSA